MINVVESSRYAAGKTVRNKELLEWSFCSSIFRPPQGPSPDPTGGMNNYT
jgi:hypothetical protein